MRPKTPATRRLKHSAASTNRRKNVATHAASVISRNTLRDVSYSVRVLLKITPSRSSSCSTLALGIGANTAIFSFANGILLRPLPYPHPTDWRRR
jgi:hypothetical protein